MNDAAARNELRVEQFFPRCAAAIVYLSLQQVAAGRDAPGEMDNGYGADLLYTSRFDDAGKWKIVKIHRMSEKKLKRK